jgi:hypothetical protein
VPTRSSSSIRLFARYNDLGACIGRKCLAEHLKFGTLPEAYLRSSSRCFSFVFGFSRCALHVAL